ncbi:hypothetical protein YA0089_28015 [Pseudomonas viridiflava]|uniref:hypothetical protein n=1 Tax=Pseudomonas viridiflava TaxID=33069 RepID=UPI0018E5F9FF|nr:hypothetical protein [Pseudomonas viridiflava]MBI6727468.1 hypothetical protein [Pseudomonas viridiflava]
MPHERFKIYKGHGMKKPWVVEDTHAEPAEDPVVYHFRAEKLAISFQKSMIEEHCPGTGETL